MAINPIENGESGLSVRNKINNSFTELAGSEKLVNKSQNVAEDVASPTKYPTVKAIVDWVNGLFEKLSNKSQDVATDIASTTKYPTVKSIADWANGLFEKIANKSQNIYTDRESVTKYPSTKAAYDYIEAKRTKFNGYTPTVLEQSGVDELGLLNFVYTEVSGFYMITGRIAVLCGANSYLQLSSPVALSEGELYGTWNSANGSSGVILPLGNFIRLNFYVRQDDDVVFTVYGEL
jgi:hypothetical protein